jgi:hypothetical protein
MTHLGTALFATVLLAVAGDSAVQAAPSADFGDIGWIDGVKRRIYGTVFTTPKRAGIAIVYVAGPVNADAPLDDVTLDPHFPYVHDHVSPKVPYGESQQVSFRVLRPGPAATSANLRLRTVVQNPDIPPIEPEDGSFHITPTLDMPYAIDLGAGFVDLTSMAVVDAGIAAGILTTVEIARDIEVTGWTGGTIESE